MKVYQITHPVETPIVHPVPDPDKFAAEVLSVLKLPTLDPATEIGPFQKGDINSSSDGFYRLSNSVLLFTQAAYDSEMSRLLDLAGNVHPSVLLDTGEKLYFLNVTAVYNCLDAANTVFYTRRGEEKGVDHGKGVKTPAFFPKLFGDSKLFRIPQMPLTIFAASDGSGDDFYQAYRNSGLHGLKFTEVWSDE